MSFPLDKYIRRVPDYPKKGVLFYDLTSVFNAPEAFSHCIDRALELYRTYNIDAIAATEARGLILGSPIAYQLKKPLIFLRKKGKLPGPVISASFDLEYGTDQLELQPHNVQKGWKIMLIDDLLATGGTARAGITLLEQCGASVTDLFTVIELSALLKDDFQGIRKMTLLRY